MRTSGEAGAMNPSMISIAPQFVSQPSHEEPASSTPLTRAIKVLAFMEASWVTGPGKNLLEFARRASTPSPELVPAALTVATFQRGRLAAPNAFVAACGEAGINAQVIRERFLFDPGVVSQIRKLINENHPAIVQTHGVKSHFLMRLCGVPRSSVWIAFHHGYTWTSGKMRLYNQFDRISLRKPQQIVTVCRAFATQLEQIGVPLQRIAIQHNSVREFVSPPKEAILSLKRKLRVSDDARVLLSVGRLSKEKGHADLFHAFAELLSKSGDRRLRLIIVGSGPEKTRLENLAAMLRISDCVVFAGQCSDMAPFYAMADIMVLPSHSEGSPNTVLEAIAAAVPIVATMVGGVPEILTNEQTALLVEKQNPTALATGVARFLDDEALRRRISSAARSLAGCYSPNEYCRTILSMYQRLLGSRRMQERRNGSE